MYRKLLALSLIFGVPTVAAAQTAPGFSAGDIAVRLAFADIDPLVGTSHVNTSATLVGGSGGKVDVSNGVEPEVDLNYFLTDNISLQLIATATRHEVSVTGTRLNGVANLGGRIDIASTYVLPPAIMAQWNFMPHAAFDPYIGLGVDLLWPFDTQENKMTNAQAGLTVLGLPPNGQVIQKVGLSNAIGPVLEGGFNYNIMGPWFLNLDYKQVFNQVSARVHTVAGLVKAGVALDPAVFSAGIVYRF